jgi:hypothetical protein
MRVRTFYRINFSPRFGYRTRHQRLRCLRRPSSAVRYANTYDQRPSICHFTKRTAAPAKAITRRISTMTLRLDNQSPRMANQLRFLSLISTEGRIRWCAFTIICKLFAPRRRSITPPRPPHCNGIRYNDRCRFRCNTYLNVSPPQLMRRRWLRLLFSL